MTVYKIKDVELEKYLKVVIRRDMVKDEAQHWEEAYLREFGESLCKRFEEEIFCIRLRKKIHFCQLKRNYGIEINEEEMEKEVDDLMKNYQEQLDALRYFYGAAKDAEAVTQIRVIEAKKKYRGIAKRIHPDVNPLTAFDKPLQELWEKTAAAYAKYDVEALETIRIMVDKRLNQLGENDDETEYEIEDIEEKIEKIQLEIDHIINTDPYQFGIFLLQEDLVREKHEELEEAILQYQQLSIELQNILENLLSGGDVTVI